MAHLHHIVTALHVNCAGFGEIGEKFSDGGEIAILSSVGTSCPKESDFEKTYPIPMASETLVLELHSALGSLRF